MTASATLTIQKTKAPTILQRIAERDKTAAKDCIDTYGDFIWTLARKFTASKEDAARATGEIFIDIWQCRGERTRRGTRLVEEKLIAKIALRRLIKPFQNAGNKSMVTVVAANEPGAGTDGISRFV